MANVLTRGTSLPTQVVSEMFNAVTGKSSLAKLAQQRPIPFNGTTEFVFSLDKEIDIVAENGAKENGGATVTAKTIRPIKFEYGTRVSDEFLYGTEEYRMDVLRQFAEGAAIKAARGLDIGAFHGFNPRTGTTSAVINGEDFDHIATANTVTYVANSCDANIDAAIAMLGDGVDATGIAISPTLRNALAALTANGARKYPEFAFGGQPSNLGAMVLDTNSTVSFGNGATGDHAILGDFRNAFRWGYAKEIPLEVIEYGNPDNDGTAGDLKGHNQVYLRAEFYIGWAILDGSRFARITVE